jgi:hypothetical protein
MKSLPMKSVYVKCLLLVSLLLTLFACGAGTTRAQERVTDKALDAGDETSVERGSLAEIKDKRSVMLLVGRSLSVDARTPAKVSAEDVQRALEDPRARTHLSAYRIIGRKLNKYIRKYESLTSVETRTDAQFYIIFKIMQERRSFIDNQPYSYGKLFVVLPGGGEARRPRVLWESKGEMMLAEDAASDLIKALKELRGEK